MESFLSKRSEEQTEATCDGGIRKSWNCQEKRKLNWRKGSIYNTHQVCWKVAYLNSSCLKHTSLLFKLCLIFFLPNRVSTVTEREREGRSMGNRKHRKFDCLPGEEEEGEEEACKEIRAWLLVVHGFIFTFTISFLFSQIVWASSWANWWGKYWQSDVKGN